MSNSPTGNEDSYQRIRRDGESSTRSVEASVNGSRKIIFAAMFTIVFGIGSSVLSSATDIYIAQNSAGGNTGADCADAHSASWFNSSSNWGTNSTQIAAGTTVHLCGTFTGSAGVSVLTVQASGKSGNVIEVLFESGATLTAPYWSTAGAINLGGYANLLVDGGTNGIIQATANGSGLANQQVNTGIYTTGGNVEIRNLTIANLYVHSSAADTAVDQTQVNCIRFSGSNISIHNNTMHDAGWCLYEPYQSGDGTISIYDNTIYNIDHGWALATSQAGGSSGPFNFYSNQVYGYANWDSTNDAYHHDGVHCYTSGTGGNPAHITGLNIYNNLFQGPVGQNVTAHVFLEGGSSSSATPCADSSSPVAVYNNVMVADQPINNGLMGLFSGNYSIYDNTMIGSSTSNGVCFSANSLVSGMLFKNNVLSTCNQLINISNSISFTPDYNSYGNGGSNAFVCNNNYYNTNQLSSWQSCIGGDSHSTYNSNLSLSSLGMPQSASPVIGAGTNLTSLGMTTLDSDTTAGDTRTPSARAASGSWDIGAYAYAAAPSAPTGLSAVVE